MCGIAGIFAYHQAAPPVREEELVRIRDHMSSRGPDGAGLWMSSDSRVGLGHRRLAIIDLSPTGAQPMTWGDGRLRITFNGEIYNYRELRHSLEGKGYQFASTSDTEVLLCLYADRGENMVHSLRGMYAFAIWDEARQGLFLARDPFGIKPLYYGDDGKTIRVASQVKALLSGGALALSPEPAGHVGFFLWGHVPEPFTLYKGIRALEAGSTMWVDRTGSKKISQYFNVATELRAATADTTTRTREVARDELHEALLESVRYHLVADVPVGVFLSAGLDSTTITALAMETGAPNLQTVTLGFKEFEGTNQDEVPLAEMVARYYGTHHQTKWVATEDFYEARQHLMASMDQPSTDAVNSYFVSKAAAESGLKVALSGLGGDELFGGYPSFEQIPSMVRGLSAFASVPMLGRGFRFVSAPLLKRLTSPKYAGLIEYGGTFEGAYLLRRGMFMPWELPQLLDADMVRSGWMELRTLPRLRSASEGLKEPRLKVAALEASWYMRNQLLRDTDWASMAHSLEIRVPLLDLDLFRTVASLGLIGVQSKLAMAEAPRKPLPAEIKGRKKTGFAIPVREWLLGQNPWLRKERGLRGWAKYLHAASGGPTSRVLALIPDAFGGHGGIALYNRDFLTALCSHERVSEVVAFPRHAVNELEPMPPKLKYVARSIGGKLRYSMEVFSYIAKRPRTDLIVCGHINLLPLAYIARLFLRAPVLLETYGIDAWQPTRSVLANFLAKRVAAVASISEVTRQRFQSWAGQRGGQTFIVPNAIHLERYGPGPKNPALVARYGLEGAVVLMTFGRMVSEERYKGFDEVLEVMPSLLKTIPRLTYLIAGSGADADRLRQKALKLGLDAHVVFTGLVQECEKADHYRLADVYVMPSQGEGFGFVILEALACGVPVVASNADGGREAIRNGELGILVNPKSPVEIIEAIQLALGKPRRILDGLAYFSFDNFQVRVHRMVDVMLNPALAPARPAEPLHPAPSTSS